MTGVDWLSEWCAHCQDPNWYPAHFNKPSFCRNCGERLA